MRRGAGNAEVITQPQSRPVAMMSHSSVRSPLKPAETERLTRRRLRLAQFTVAYNVVEGAVAITAGRWPGLVALVGFEVDFGSKRPPRSSSDCAWPPDCATGRPLRPRNGGR